MSDPDGSFIFKFFDRQKLHVAMSLTQSNPLHAKHLVSISVRTVHITCNFVQ